MERTLAGPSSLACTGWGERGELTHKCSVVVWHSVNSTLHTAASSSDLYWTAELRVQRTCSVEQSATSLAWKMSLATFKTKLKTYLFSGVHNDSRRPPGAVAAFSRFRCRDISDFTYLLTYLLTPLSRESHTSPQTQWSWLHQSGTHSTLTNACLKMTFVWSSTVVSGWGL